jgi:deoxyribodipyrimidine photolyase
MEKQALNIIWLKRDLRLQDHEGFFRAEASPLDYLVVYIFDEHLLKGPDCSLRHHQFVYHSLLDLNKQLAPYEREIKICYGESAKVFNFFARNYTIKQVFSYKESGTQRTWDRDKEVEQLFKLKDIKWVPELAPLPTAYIHEPWNITPLERSMMGDMNNYPEPIVDVMQSASVARKKIWAYLSTLLVQQENARILKKHTQR